MSFSKNLPLYVVTYPLSILSRYIPKSRNIWLFGSWSGTQYNDNSKYLFRYVNENCGGIRAVWVTRSRETLNTVRSEGYECHLMYSFRGIMASLFSHVAILSRAKAEDLPIYISPYSTKIVQLWHGTPLKKLGRDKQECVNDTSDGVRYYISQLLRRIVFPQSNNNYSIFIASSEEIGGLLDSAYGHWMKPGAIRVTGYPRNDVLHHTTRTGDARKGIYMPTFRDWDRTGETLFNSYGFDAARLDDTLGNLHVKLDMKLHPETKLPDHVASVLCNSKNIELVTYIDVYEYLGEYDFIITDYSSIYFDYLVLDRPIIFTPFDLEQYISGRGMYFNYHDVTPGIKSYSWDEVIRSIETIVAGYDEYGEQRKAINSRFNVFLDDDNCKRVVDEIKAL